uniref:Peptidase_M13_N domain-containing protein n=1 Tax=Anisakis simplex TaxID=6269 RepID=A0A0M3JAE1_ANISI
LHYRVARLEPSKLTEVIKAFALGKMYRTFLWNYLKLRDNFTESALNYPEWMSVLRHSKSIAIDTKIYSGERYRTIIHMYGKLKMWPHWESEQLEA